MRKHFLLLFLMALLPLAGWAVDVEVRPFDASVTWTGKKPATVQASWITCLPAVDDAVKTEIAKALTIQDLDNYNVGNHTYKLQKIKNSVVVNETTYNLMVSSSYSAELTIEKFEGDPVFTTTDLAFRNDDLFYTSEAQALLSGGATATANGFAVPVVYATSATAENWVSWENLKEINANTTGYTVYYKVAETVNYAGSDVKTMDGTKAIGKATITFNLSAAAGLTYNGAPQALLALTDNAKPATNFGASTLQYKIDDAEAWAELPEAGIAGITGTSAKNEVAYSINLKVPADENGNWDETTIATPIATTIAKATPIFNFVPTHENGGLATGLGYDPQQTHQLVLQQATAIVENTEISVPVKYSMRRYKNVSKGYTSWGDKTYDQLVGNSASRYQIRVKTDVTDDLNQAIQSLEDVTIARATIPADAYTEPVEKNVRTTGALQPLVVPAAWKDAETTYGTFQYSLTNNGNDWSTDVPQGSDVAEYTVYWRIYPTVTSGTQNYDIVSGNYTSNITAKSKVTVTTAANQSFGYGTTPTIQKTVAWEVQGEDDLNEAGLTWKFYAANDAECTGDEVEKVNGYYPVGTYNVIASGLAVTGTTAASQEIVYVPALVKITAGQIVASIDASSTYGGALTYTLTHKSGLSTTEAATLNANSTVKTVTIKNKETGAIVTYKDGDENKELKDVVLDSEAEGYNAAAKAALAKLNAGPYTLEATAEYTPNTNYALIVSAGTLTVSAKSIAGATINVDTDADAIVYNNKAWGTVNPIEFTVTETSGIEAADYDVTYSNNVNAGTATITLTGKRNYAGTKTQNFTIKRAALKITANNTNWTYGTTEPTYAVTVEGQAEGETALEVGGNLAGIDGALTVVRTSNETVGMHAGALVAKFGADQPAESDNYTITYSAGNLQVAKAEGVVVIKLKDKVGSDSQTGATYGENPATRINDAIRNIENYEYVSGLPEAEAANFASIINVSAATYSDLADAHYEVGKDYTFTIAGATSTNYNVKVQDGTYCVGKKSPIVLFAKPQTIDFTNETTDDDAPNKVVSDATVGVDTNDSKPDLQYDDEVTDLVASIDITTTKIGENPITLTAKENGNYEIHLTSGVLTVIGEEETIQFDLDGTDLAKIQSYASETKAYNVRIKLTRRNVMNAGTANEKVYTWNKFDWNTMVLPFEVTVRELSRAIGYAIVNVYDETNTKASDAGFKVTMGTIPANTPFLLKTDADIDGTTDFYIEFEGKNIVAPTAPMILTAENGISYIGTYESVVINNENSQGLDASNPTYYKYYADDKIKGVGKTSSNKYTAYPFSAFFNWTAPTGSASEMTITVQDMDGTTTTIRSIETEGKNVTDGLYNLQGVKMQGAPTQKGIYIKDGKKVVIK